MSDCAHHWISECDQNVCVIGEVICTHCLAVWSQQADAAVKSMFDRCALTVSGIGRDEHAPHGAALILYLNRRPTDDEMRAIHEGIRDLVNGG